MKLVHTMVSETGLRRTNNEDAALFIKPDKPWLAQSLGTLSVVSDGMGGYERGEKASAMVVDILSKEYFNGMGQPAEKLREAAINVNNAVALEGMASAQKMGATCTALVILEDQLHFMHIGDSRGYILKSGVLTQMTSDHTAANEYAHSDHLNKNENKLINNPHALTKAMGVAYSNTCQADVFSVVNNLQKGDKIILCSDGLYLHINDSELKEILQQKTTLKDITDQLVKIVLRRGAMDNFSFILMEYEE